MNKEEIIQQLTNAHLQFANQVTSFNENDFTFVPTNKWSAGQQLDHIVRSVTPLIWAFKLPRFITRLVFGKANRVSKDYDTLVMKYTSKLANGGKATGPFIPNIIEFKQRDQQAKKLLAAVQNICNSLSNFSEQQLDDCILPHPLLGKLTMREMLYFTIYHVQHHHKIMMKNLASSNVQTLES